MYTRQDIPIGHVEKCAHELAVLLGSSPADASLRASLRALLIAETLRGGARSEVAAYVRRLASLIADAASRARPLPAPVTPSPRQHSATTTATAFDTAAAGQGQDASLSVPGTGDVGGWEFGVDSSGNAGGEETQAHAQASVKGGDAAGEGGADAHVCAVARGLVEYNDDALMHSPPVTNLLRDSEGAAAYAHALVHIARSKKRQWEAAACVAAGEDDGAARIEALWKSEADAPPAAPAASPPQTAGAGMDPTNTVDGEVQAGTKKHATRTFQACGPAGRRLKTPTAALPDWGQSESVPSVVPSQPAPAPEVECAGTRSAAAASPPPKVVGGLPGALPFSSSGEALLLHAKAMVGLKRTQRWAEAWLALPAGSSAVGWRLSPPLAAAVIEIVEENNKIAAAGSPSPLDPVFTGGQPEAAVQRTVDNVGGEIPDTDNNSSNANATTTSTSPERKVDKTSPEYLAGFAAAVAEPEEKAFAGRYAWGVHAASERTSPLWPPNASTLAALGLKMPRKLALNLQPPNLPPAQVLPIAPQAGAQHTTSAGEAARHAAAAAAAEVAAHHAAAHHAAAHHAAHHAAAQHAAAAAAATAASGSMPVPVPVPFAMMNPFWAQASAAAAAAATVNAQLHQRSLGTIPILSYSAGAGASGAVATPLAGGAPAVVTPRGNHVAPMANAPVALTSSPNPAAGASAAPSTHVPMTPSPASLNVSVASTGNPASASAAAAAAGVGVGVRADGSSPAATAALPT